MNDDDIIKASKTIGTIAGSLLGVLLTLGIILGIFIVLALIFPINPDKVQGWFAAWIQGVFWLQNWIISWFKDPWYIRAPLRCKSYNFWFWFGVVSNVWGIIKVILSLISNIRRKMPELHELCNRWTLSLPYHKQGSFVFFCRQRLLTWTPNAMPWHAFFHA